MAFVAAVAACVDRFEAAHGDGDAATTGSGLEPWTEIAFDEAAAACQRAGKRLCRSDEWRAACRGPCDRLYPYGAAYSPQACDDLEGNAGRGLQPAGAYVGCEGGVAGVFDLAGNAREWVDPGDGGARAAGGSYDDPSVDATCDALPPLPATTRDPRVGFRCCLTP